MLKSTKLNRFFIFGEHNVIAASPLQSMRLVSRYVALTPGKLRHICVSFLDLIELYKTSFTRSYLVFIMVRKKNTLLQTVFYLWCLVFLMNLKLIHEIVVFSEEVNRRKEFEASQTDRNESGLYFTVQPYVTLVGYLWIDSAVSTNRWRKTFVNDKVKKKGPFMWTLSWMYPIVFPRKMKPTHTLSLHLLWYHRNFIL